MSISTCWLVEPFINTLEVGDVINLTAFYYMSPQQQLVNQRCISPLVGSFVAFNVQKVNPFNQMIGSDSRLASLFYNHESHIGSRQVSCPTSKSLPPGARRGHLTLENLRLHDKVTREANDNFLPKMNRLMHRVSNRPTT